VIQIITKMTSLLDRNQKLHSLLISLNQSHLFQDWDLNSPLIPSFYEQVNAFHTSYPGGLPSYLNKAKSLLRDAEQGVNPFDGMVPKIPDGENLEHMTTEFLNAERIGIEASHKTAFVLVAGGMGERLGYNGIKIALPSETTSNVTFLELYLTSIMALQQQQQKKMTTNTTTASTSTSTSNTKSNATINSSTTTSNTTTATELLHIPIAIMTSAETHDKTVSLLESNNYYGFPKDRIFLMKQDKVPCLSDSQATLTRDPTNMYQLMTKPHGHGDVHYLLHQTGIAKKWKEEEGREWIVFFQDTNGLVFRSMCASLGISVLRDFDSNSITGVRKAKQSMGAICKLINQKDNSYITTNVEYNLLDPMLRDSPKLYPNGDVNDETTGYSPFPGNMNQLIFKLSTYVTTLSKHSGLVPEFVNPKYQDESKTSFKKPTRLECMMQDLPRQFVGGNVGFTTVTSTIDAIRFYNPVKNNVMDAYQKQINNMSPACAASGEHLMYENICLTLIKMGVVIEKPIQRIWSGTINVMEFSRISLPPHLSMTLDMLSTVFPTPKTVTITQKSTLLVVGKGTVILQNFKLNGACVIYVPEKNDQILLNNVEINNKGWEFVALSNEREGKERKVEKEHGGATMIDSIPESLIIRGYALHKMEECEFVSTKTRTGVSGNFEGSRRITE